MTKGKAISIFAGIVLIVWMIGLFAMKVNPVSEQPQEDTVAAFEQQDDVTARENMVLNYYNGEPKNPLYNKSATNRQVYKLVFDPIIGLDQTLKPVSDIAQRFEKEDDRITLTIREGVSFFDGTKLKASDIKEVLDFIGQNPELPYFEVGQKILRVNVLSDDSLEIVFSKEDSIQLAELDIPVVKNPKDENCDIGTGMFYFSDDGESLLANENYFGNQPSVRVIELVSLPDSEAMDFAFKCGDSDVLDVGTKTDSRLTYYGDFKEYTYTSLNFVYLCVNPSGVFADPAVRSYVNGLLNRDKICENRCVSIDTPFFPGWWAIDQTGEEKFSSLSDIGFSDVDGDGLLEYGEGEKLPVVTILVNGDNEEKTGIAKKVCDQLSIAGFTAQVNALPFEEYQAALQKGNFSLALIETVLNKSNRLSPLFSQSGALNYGSFYDPSLEVALWALEDSASQEEYQDKAQGLYQSILEQTPIIPLFFRQGTIITSSEVTGGIQPMTDHIFYGFDQWKRET